eukprot:CAMPEP_0118893450 /NCGR_PEP_ID=MMETSP1166-20130328/2650_1 /TAXON_ID=1104430 /ORGANISM="Chrysoreinhardia sp, Strain CCMP3193" /LENGTH=1646 /DNA_ID=CAMNT_0006832261 /DNA_START=151 /DNA_END=5091 /DNA_ORIENTATION=+
MGVRGLTTLVKQRGRTAAEEVPAGSVLLVDGSGLVNFLLRGDRFELGGDYARLERMVETYVDRLRKTYRVVVYRDGEKRRMKEATRLKRLEQRREEWRTLETWVSTTGRFVGAAAAQLPRPTLAYECFYLCVARLGVKIVDCEEEADQELAKARGYVLAEDSDFMVFRQCRYVPLEEFEKLASKRPVRVYDRDSVAAALDIAPAERLVDLAILLGNDYTGHLPRQDLAKLCPLNDKAPPDQVLRWVVDQPPTWRVDAGGDEVAFSRAFYDLEPLDAFPFDPLPSEDEDDGAPTFLPDDDDDDDDENDVVDDFDAKLPASALFALRYLGRALGATWDPSFVEALFRRRYTFRMEYCDAVALMLRALEQNTSGGLKKTRRLKKQATVDGAASFADVQASYRYQTAVKRGLGATTDTNVSIADVFDGPTFHAVLVQIQSPNDDDDDQENDDQEPEEEEAFAPPPAVLPIDAHEEEILGHVGRNRVTILVGETGSGKSSRTPMMLLDQDPKARMFVSQPRRIAARTLCDRVRASLPQERRKEIGLRLGHGERDEDRGTRLWFATTGYLVRLIASYPNALERHTHLVIDEVHERSVDGEVLCLLARRLLQTNQKIRLILMSATLSAELLGSYFGTTEPHLFVGARRFQNVEYFSDDLFERLGGMPSTASFLASKITNASSKNERYAQEAPHVSFVKHQYDLAVCLIDRIGSPRSSILVFVAGLNDIVELTEKLAKLSDRQQRTITTLAIHSDVPYEEQAKVFTANDDPTAVRVVLATNAAESSVTIPDCDHVVDLGLSKQILYNPRTHRQLLQTSWISQSSAIQRAGRTGRVRPGNVYRLYSRHRFHTMMRPHDVSDIHKTPLDSVVLNFYAMLRSSSSSSAAAAKSASSSSGLNRRGGRNNNDTLQVTGEPGTTTTTTTMNVDESISDLLAETLEPPAPTSVARAFESLHAQGFLTQPDDWGDLTGMGSFVSSLGLDLSLGRLVGLGAQLGCLDDAVTLAAVLSQPQSPWRKASPLVHEDPDDYNAIVSQTYASRLKWDAGTRSEPVAQIRLLEAYQKIQSPNARRGFLLANGLVAARVNQLNAQVGHIKKRVLAALALQPPQETSGKSSSSGKKKKNTASSRTKKTKNKKPHDDEEADDKDKEDSFGSDDGRKDVATDLRRLTKLRLLLTWTARDNLFRLDGVRDAAALAADGTLRCKVQGPTLSTRHVDSLNLPSGHGLSGGARTQYTVSNVRPYFAPQDPPPQQEEEQQQRHQKQRHQQKKKSPNPSERNVDELFYVLEARLREVAFGTEAPGRIDCAWVTVQCEKTTPATLFATKDGLAVAGDVAGLMERSGGGGGGKTRGRPAASQQQQDDDLDLFRVTTTALSKTARKRLNDLAEHVACVSASVSKDGGLVVTAATVELQPRLHIAMLLGVRPFDPALPEFKHHRLVSKQVIAFRPDEQDDDDPHPRGEPWGVLPKAARFVSAMATGYRDSKLRLWADANDKDRGKLEVKIAVPTPSYRCVSGDRNSRKVFMSDHTLAKTDVDLTSAASQYGVAASMLDIGADLAKAEGVTMLPPGDKWLTLAQAAFGDPDALKARNLTRQERDLLQDINECAADAGEVVRPFPKMTQLLDDLFANVTEDDPYEDDDDEPSTDYGSSSDYGGGD